MSILGHEVVRREDPALLTTGGTYVDDLAIEGAVHAVYVRSTIAHGELLSIDTSEAVTAPGVVAVLTAADVDLPDLPAPMMLNQGMVRPTLARDRVRFVGEPVAVVVAESREAAVDAAELVIVDIEPLPVLIDPVAALDADAPRLYPDLDDNVVMAIDHRGDPISFDDCEVVVEFTTINQRVAPAPIESRSAIAWWDEAGRLVVEIGCQGTHAIRTTLATLYDLEPAQVRVICPDVGGGFGAKAQAPAEALLLGSISRRVGRPVRWAETRSENLVAMTHGRGQVHTIKLGGTREGDLLAYRINVIQEAGGYPGTAAMLPYAVRIMASGCYDIGRVQLDARSVATNTTPVGAYRGAGRPEAAAAIERAVDLFALEAGLDPAEVRRRNFIQPEQFPHRTATGTTYDCGDYEGALDRALDAAGYAELRAEQTRRRAAGDRTLLGIGVSSYVEITAGTGGKEYGSVELLPGGRARVVTGSNPYGQGHVTAWSMLVSELTGLPLDAIDVIYGDTDLVPSGEVTGGSRSLQVAGSAVFDAAGKLVDLARERAAELLEASVDDLVLDTDTGRFHVAGTPAVSVDWAAVADSLEPSDGTLLAISDFEAAGPTYPFGTHVAVVEIDSDTGEVELVRMVACDDAGRILNPLLVDGQVHGGLAQGIAQALYEQVVYDEMGNPMTATFIDYCVPSAAEFPTFERIAMETPTPLNPLGAKGIGESGTIGAMPAVQNAVIDALSHLGVRHLDMPLTPERVWRAISAVNS